MGNETGNNMGGGYHIERQQDGTGRIRYAAFFPEPRPVQVAYGYSVQTSMIGRYRTFGRARRAVERHQRRDARKVWSAA